MTAGLKRGLEVNTLSLKRRSLQRSGFGRNCHGQLNQSCLLIHAKHSFWGVVVNP